MNIFQVQERRVQSLGAQLRMMFLVILICNQMMKISTLMFLWTTINKSKILLLHMTRELTLVVIYLDFNLETMNSYLQIAPMTFESFLVTQPQNNPSKLN